MTKGAPQVILSLAANADAIRPQVEQAVEGLAERGFRALGVGRCNEQNQWQFVGVLPLYDPVRADSAATIKTAEQLGVRVKMVTGDQTAIAKETARQLDLGTNILDASTFEETTHYPGRPTGRYH